MRFLAPRQLCLGGILAAFMLTGCGSSKPAGGYATFSWYLFDIQDTSYLTPLSCDQVGAATVMVTLTNVDDGTLGYTQAAACADGVLSTPTVPAGAYYARFDLYGDPAIYGNTTTLLDGFDATDDAGNNAVFHIRGGANDFTLSYAPFVAQSFMVSWAISAQSLPTTCAAVGAAYVYLSFSTIDPVGGTSNLVTSPFYCTQEAGVSYAIPFGPQQAQWSLALVDATGADIQVLSGGVVDLPDDTDVNLGPQYFSF